MSVARLVGFLVEFANLGFNSSTQNECSHFSRFVLGFNSVVLLVVGDVTVDSKMPTTTLSIYLEICQFGFSEMLIRIECLRIRSE